MLKRLAIYGPLAAIMLLVTVFYACHKEGGFFSRPDPAAPMTMDLAQNYFYNNLIKQPGSFYPPKSAGGKANWKFVLFKKGYASQTPDASFVEIPLLYNQRPSVLIQSSSSGSGIAQQQGSGNKISEKTAAPSPSSMASPADADHLNGTFDRLLIYKNKTTNEIAQSIVTYIPDQDYLQRHHNDVSNNQITQLDPDFNGYIQYRSWNDKLQFTLKIQNGKSVKVFMNNADGKTSTRSQKAAGSGGQNAVISAGGNKQTETVICITTYTYHYEQMCYYTVMEDETIENCGAWVLAGVDVFQDCYDDGSGSGAPPPTGNPCIDYGYCGTPTPPPANPPPPPPVTTSTADHKLPHPNTLPPNNTTNTQAGQLCVFKTMEWVSLYFGGTLTSGQALTFYANSKGLNVGQVIQLINTQGIPSADLDALAFNYFNTATTNNMFASIDNGWPLMGTLLNPDGTGHEVMVTGYNNNGTCEYFDPQTGTYKTELPMNFHNVIEIQSKK